MPLEEREVHRVRLPYEIEQIADERHDAEDHVDADIQQHPHLNDARDTHPMRLNDDRGTHEGREQVTNPRNETDDGVPAEAKPCTGNAKRFVEEAHELTKAV